MSGLEGGNVATLGYLIGEIGAFPFAFSGGSSQDREQALGVAGAAIALGLFADEPLMRRLPMCPLEMRTLANNRVSDHFAACRSSRLLMAALGAGSGAVVAFGLAWPTALAGNRAAAKNIFIVMPVAGAVLGAIRAGNRPPCAAS